jgi:hypothetical protein
LKPKAKTPKQGKTCEEKYKTRTEIEVKLLEKSFADIPANSETLIATTKVFEDYHMKIKEGKSKTLKEVRQDLAAKYSAGHTCPIATGIFLRIVAEANFERLHQGVPIEKIAPFWRVIEPGSNLAKKLSFGQEFTILMRQKEGI